MANAKADGTAPPGSGGTKRSPSKPGGVKVGGGTPKKGESKSPRRDKRDQETRKSGATSGGAKTRLRKKSTERKTPTQNGEDEEIRAGRVRVKKEVIEGRLPISEWVGMIGDTAKAAITIQDDTVTKTPKRNQDAMKEGDEATHSPAVKRINADGRVLDFEPFADDSRKETEDTKGMEVDPIEIEGKDEGGQKNRDDTTKQPMTKKDNERTTVVNPYNTTTQDKDDKDPTPQKGNTTKDAELTLTWAQKANSPQSHLKTHERIREAHESYFEVGFIIKAMESNTPMEETITKLREVIRALLLRAKEIDRKSKINPWSDDCELPTIAKYEDIPFNPRHLKTYLCPNRMGLGLRAGSNNGWRVRITTRISRQEFLHHWGLSKREFTKVQYVTLREAPLQNSTYHAAGYFLNSSDGQITEELEKALTEELGFQVGINYKPAALDKRAADQMWVEAKKQKMRAPEYIQTKTFFKHAPFAQQVYAPTRAQAHQAAMTLSQKYGSPEANSQYPRLPDGTRMRFIAASIYLDMQGRATAANLFHQQVKFQTTEVTATIPIRDPNQKFPTQNDRTMQQLLLDLKDSDREDEPFFRHLRKKFHWNFKTDEYEVSIHGQMYQRSAGILRNLKQVVTKEYGPEVGEAILDGENDAVLDHQSRGGMSGITIATEDRYLNGPAKFIIEGLENVRIGKDKSLAELRKEEQDAHTMNIKSTTSGMSGETGNTVPDCDAYMSITTTQTHRGNLKDGNEARSQDQGTKSTTTNTNTDDPSGSKRNSPNGGWIVKGGAAAAKALAQHVASSLTPGGSAGGGYP